MTNLPTGKSSVNSVGAQALDCEPATRLDNTGTIRPKAKLTCTKIILSGSLTEDYTYQYPIQYGKICKKRRKCKLKKNITRSDEYRSKTIGRALNAVRRLTHLNFTERDKFLTFTFNNSQPFDINDLSSCLPFYQKAMRLLRRSFPNLKYISVPEFQKRGAVHYHILCNLPYITKSDLVKIWPYGFSKPKAIRGTTHLAFYLCKYLGKKFDDTRKQGHRLFYTSQNLKKPIVIYQPPSQQLSDRLQESEQYSNEYESSYESKFNGKVTVRQYLAKK